jgi:uncharacterized membrane protein
VKTFLILATLMVAIICGLMYAYACSVNPGLRKLKDVEYLHAMQSINRAILNPWFLWCFMGALPLQLMSAWLVHRSEINNDALLFVGLSSVIYFGGVILVTGMGNVPLNEALDKTAIDALSNEALRMRRDAFEIPWNRFHSIRTVASVASLVLMLVALLRIKT